MKASITLLILTFVIKLYSQQSLPDSVNLNLPKKKIKSREIYFGRYLPFFNVENEKTWSGVFESDLAVDSTYYSFQYHRINNVKIKGTRGLTIGYSKKRKLMNKLYMKTGFGLNIMNMEYQREFTNDTIRVLTEYKIVQSGISSSIESKEINEQKSNYYFEGPFRVGAPYHFITSSLQLPIGLEYSISPTLYVGGNFNFNFVFKGLIYSRISNAGRDSYSYEETDLIKRSYASIGLYVKYNVYRNFFLDINSAFQSDPFKYRRGFNVSFLDGAKSIYGYNFGLRIGYNF